VRKARREIPGALESLLIFQKSFFGRNPSSLAVLQNELKRPKALGFSIRLIVFSRDETPGANPAHPGILSRGFARRVSSYLTPNILMFERDSMFQVTKGTRRKGSLQKD
jgi:hypothetical protein